MMRVCLIAPHPGNESSTLEHSLRQLVHSKEGMRLEILPGGPSFLEGIRLNRPDVLVIQKPTSSQCLSLFDPAFDMEMACLLAVKEEDCEQFAPFARRHLLWFVPVNPSLEELKLAFCGLAACREREFCWRHQVAALQQRLADRIVIERAKGILVQRLGISEEEAYNRLRVSSRRQRRQIKDIAQSLLDAQVLLVPDSNGLIQDDIRDDCPLTGGNHSHS